MTLRPDGLPARLADLDRTLVMGVLNVTPDSFSDGGHYLDPQAAIDHGLRMWHLGADLIDVGGESTRPGAQRVPLDEELRRVVPCAGSRGGAGEHRQSGGRCVRGRPSSKCLHRQRCRGGLADPAMYSAVAELGVPYIAMHWRGHSDHMNELARYDDVALDVIRELRDRVEAATAAGVDPAAIVVDPGLGFAKDADHNWQILLKLTTLLHQGYPVLIGASRKRFLGSLLADEHGEPRSVDVRCGHRRHHRDRRTMGVWAVRACGAQPPRRRGRGAWRGEHG
jgi:dihydropteroate synthase